MTAIIMRAPGASGQLRRSDWFLFVCPRTKKNQEKKEKKSAEHGVGNRAARLNPHTGLSGCM